MTPAEIWKELTRIAFIGSERAFLEKTLMDELMIRGIDLDQDITGIVLDSASLYRIAKKAGFPLLKMQVPVDKIIMAEKSKYISSAANRFFKSILHKNTLALQTEFIDILKSKKLYLAPEYLPELLEHTAISFEFKIQLPFITDKKGHWLLNQHPDWLSLIAVKDIQVWKSAGKDAREIMFYQIRHHYPELSGEFIAAVWNEISTTEKKSLINQFNIGLSELDLPCLEYCWSPKDKNLAPLISGLLLQLSESKPAVLVRQVILDSLQLEKGINGKEQLTWTDAKEKLDKLTFMHEGSDSAVNLKQYTGDLFNRPLALIPPDLWETRFNKTPEEILTLIKVFDIVTQGTHYVNKVLFQMAEAAVMFKSGNWIRVITVYLWQQWQLYPGQTPEPFFLLFSASEESVQDEMVHAIFQKKSSIKTSISAGLINYLMTISYNWKAPDLRFILTGLSNNEDFGLNYYEIEALIKDISIKCQAVMLEQLLEAFENEPLSSGKFQSAIRSAIPILRWRYQLHEILK
jgi:hypothetical protein